MPQSTEQILDENTLRVKYLKPAGDSKNVEALTKQVNEWIKSRKRSEVLSVSIQGNSTKGYFALVTYNVIPRG